MRSAVADDAVSDRERPIRVRVPGRAVRKVARCTVQRIVLPARIQDREEIRAVTDIGNARTTVQPNVLLAVIDVAVDERVPVLTVTGPIRAFVDGRECRSGHMTAESAGHEHENRCRQRGEDHDERAGPRLSCTKIPLQCSPSLRPPPFQPGKEPGPATTADGSGPTGSLAAPLATGNGPTAPLRVDLSQRRKACSTPKNLMTTREPGGTGLSWRPLRGCGPEMRTRGSAAAKLPPFWATPRGVA